MSSTTLAVFLGVGVGLLAGCGSTSSSEGWQQDVSGLVKEGNAMIAAVAALPECADLPSKAGKIQWQSEVFCGSGFLPVKGCTYPTAHPVVQVIFQSGWGVDSPENSTLAHELCHACGYTDEREASACAERAKVNFKRPTPALTAPARPAEETAALIEAAGREASAAVKRGAFAEARQTLEGALRAIDPDPAPTGEGVP